MNIFLFLKHLTVSHYSYLVLKLFNDLTVISLSKNLNFYFYFKQNKEELYKCLLNNHKPDVIESMFKNFEYNLDNRIIEETTKISSKIKKVKTSAPASESVREGATQKHKVSLKKENSFEQKTGKGKRSFSTSAYCRINKIINENNYKLLSKSDQKILFLNERIKFIESELRKLDNLKIIMNRIIHPEKDSFIKYLPLYYKPLIEIDKLLFYKQSRNEKGYINLVVYIDYEHIMLLPILNVEKYLLTPLIKTSTTIKTIELISQMLYDINQPPHLYIFNYFIIHHLKNYNINITSNVGIKNKQKLNIMRKNKLLNFSSIYFKNDLSNVPYNIINKELNKPGVYIISCSVTEKDFKKRKFYYIGSSVNIKKRNETRIKNGIFNIFNDSKDKMDFFSNQNKQFLDLTNSKKLKKRLEHELGSLYLTIDYFNEFKLLYPNYTLSKGEWVILNKLSDFHLKILEQSLIYYIQKTHQSALLIDDKVKIYTYGGEYLKNSLNTRTKVSYRFAEWRKEWLYYYNKEKEYSKATKVRIYSLVDYKYFLRVNRKDLLKNGYKYYEFSFYENPKTLSTLCNRNSYYLDMDILLKNMNSKNYFKVKGLVNPIRVVEEGKYFKIDKVLTIKDYSAFN